MAGIRGKDTKPEIFVRHHLFRLGFRYRLHAKELPGKPDIVLPRYRAVVFVNGCFWHGHEGCRLFKIPATRTEFWKHKISRNIANHALAVERLHKLEWRVAVIWECSIRKRQSAETEVIPLLGSWIISTNPYIEL